MSQKIRLRTSDDIVLLANWNAATTTLGAVILAHMYPATKESWAPFQDVLAKRGLASLAVDLRGHGESTKAVEGQTLDYRKFTDAEHLSSMEDLRAAYEWISTRGIETNKIAVAGASVGANLALRLLAENPLIPAALLLSPGLNYHGVTTGDVVPFVNPHQAVQMIVSRGDDDESVRAADQILALLAVEMKGVKKLSNAGHGTRMFEGDAALMGEAADWLRDRIQESA
jgi:alpha-beta hydrolase superfamily lysophospholipase